MYPASAQRAYYPALDILRGTAILAVVFYHNFDFVSFFRFGWMGVDLFFVLSGFLITNLLLQSVNNKFYFRNFYMRRVLRIFPLYYIVLLSFFLLSPILFSQKGPQTTFSYYNENKVWFWTYFQNWLMVEKGPAPVPFLSHFWSLAIEEQFYLIWPFILFFIRKTKSLKIVISVLITIAIVSRLCTWMMYPHEVESYYCNTFTRMDSLLMGSLLAVHIKEGKGLSANLIHLVIISFILLIAASLFIFSNVDQGNFLFPTIGYTISAIFFSVVLYLFIKKEAILINWFRRLDALRFIGKISYGIYVFHIPIYLILASQLSAIVNSFFYSPEYAALFISALSVLVTIIISAASFHFIEKPILDLKKHFT
jgi:peptidoglycan/LPS O-acetylase OafA/YrhL